ncbi:mitochondrial inner membrane translocase [Chloropicon primus]|nr:mitochondrial inner membrane translocase [Chloropicon primus]
MNGMAAVRGLGPFVSWTLGKEGVTQLHQHVARHWMRASESQVASVSSKRPSFATKAGGKGKAREEALSSLQQKDQEALSTFFHEPKGPVTAVEGASYSVVIAGGLAIAATLAYYVVTELFVEKPADKVYNKALERIQQDPRVMVRLGSPIKGYGSDSRNRRARQRISHRMVRQEDGTEHCQVQFQASGPNGRATIHADMYEKGSDWEFAYLIVDVTYPPNARARINVQTAKQ